MMETNQAYSHVFEFEPDKGIVPQEINKNVEILISKLGLSEEPRYVICQPEPNVLPNECFATIDARVEREGGRRVLGWQIWSGPLLMESEFHAVWESQDGMFIDIMARQVSKILFLPDFKTKYEGKQINNVRINISGNPLGFDYIDACDALFYIENIGERACQYGKLALLGEEAIAYRELSSSKIGLGEMVSRRETGRNSCFCGSGKKYKSCHKQIIKELKRATEKEYLLFKDA